MQCVPDWRPGTGSSLFIAILIGRRRTSSATFITGAVFSRALFSIATEAAIGWTIRATTWTTGASLTHVRQLFFLVFGEELIELLFHILLQFVDLLNLILCQFEHLSHGGRNHTSQFKAGTTSTTPALATAGRAPFFLIKSAPPTTLFLIAALASPLALPFFRGLRDD